MQLVHLPVLVYFFSYLRLRRRKLTIFIGVLNQMLLRNTLTNKIVAESALNLQNYRSYNLDML
jgi:hypothetical protein